MKRSKTSEASSLSQRLSLPRVQIVISESLGQPNPVVKPSVMDQCVLREVAILLASLPEYASLGCE